MIALVEYRNELKEELSRLLAFWQQNTIDNKEGGFYGRLDNSNTVYKEAPKGSVLNSRILWTFSAAYSLTQNKDYLQIAERAYSYITRYFIDKKYGGVYWTVDFKGNPLDTKKQIYALSFAIYGLSEFFKCTHNEQAKDFAIQLYNLVIEHSRDNIYGGYIEALSEDWQDISDLRLSSKDANEKKSMNTHLHVLEGFANLYCIWPDEHLKEKITELINIFLNDIIDKTSHHLILFFDEKWSIRSDLISYGHDIEAAWLILESAEIIGNKELVEEVRMASIQLADAAAEGLDGDGGLWYEYEPGEDHLVKEKHSWPQAEGMIGFFNAWQITGEKEYVENSFRSWQFIKGHILDKTNGEWYWGVRENYALMMEDKVGIWKCPYHNGRACMELIKRINSIVKN